MERKTGISPKNAGVPDRVNRNCHAVRSMPPPYFLLPNRADVSHTLFVSGGQELDPPPWAAKERQRLARTSFSAGRPVRPIGELHQVRGGAVVLCPFWRPKSVAIL